MSSSIDLVAFDFDGTLTHTDTTQILLSALLRINLVAVIRIAPSLISYYRGALSAQDLKMMAIGALIRGRSKAVVDCACHRFRQGVQRVVRHDVMAILAAHLDRKQRVVIASASPSFALDILFSDWPLTIVASEFDVQNGRYTGRPIMPSCYGEEKARRLSSYMSKNGISQVSVAYSDHYSDFPLLRLAKNPVLVYPDSVTRDRAGELVCSVLPDGLTGYRGNK